jgi:hypothetical protein
MSLRIHHYLCMTHFSLRPPRPDATIRLAAREPDFQPIGLYSIRLIMVPAAGHRAASISPMRSQSTSEKTVPFPGPRSRRNTPSRPGAPGGPQKAPLRDGLAKGTLSMTLTTGSRARVPYQLPDIRTASRIRLKRRPLFPDCPESASRP